MFDPPNSSRTPIPEEGRTSGGDRSPRSGRRPGPTAADRKQQRKDFRRDINRAPRPGESINGDSCLTMLVFPAALMFLLVFVLGHFGLAVLLP